MIISLKNKISNKETNLKKDKYNCPNMSNQSLMHKMSFLWTSLNRKFAIPFVWSYDLIRDEKYHPFMSAHEKRALISFFI